MSGSSQDASRIATSACAVSRSSSESPEPSAIRTPASGTPMLPSRSRTAAAPAAVLPWFPYKAPSSFSSSSAVKLSLS